MTKITNFRDLDVWKLGHEVVKNIYNLTRKFPKEEVYNLTSQMRRSVVSITSNIAEGFARKHNKEYKQFLSITLGSCAELENQLEICKSLDYMDNQKADEMLDKVNHVSRMTMNLRRCL